MPRWASLKVVAGLLLSVMAAVAVHEAGTRQAVGRDAVRVSRAIQDVERNLGSATLAVETLAQTPGAGPHDLGALAWYQVSRDHRGLLAAARVGEGVGTRLRLLSPQIPAWMTRLLLEADDSLIGQAGAGQGPETSIVPAPPEAAPGHRLYRVATAPPEAAASVGPEPSGMPPVTLLLVDATSLVAGAMSDAGLARNRVAVSDQAGVFYGEGTLSPAGAPLVRPLHFAGAEWMLHYELREPWVSFWDLLTLAVLIGGVYLCLRRGKEAGLEPPVPAVAIERPVTPTGAAAAEPPAPESAPDRARVGRPVHPVPAPVTAAPPWAAARSEREAGFPDSPVEGILELDIDDGRVVRANQAAGRLLGYRDAAELETRAGEAQRIFAEPAQYRALLDGVRRVGGVADFDADLLRRDKTRIPVAVAAWMVDGEGAPARRVAITLRDVSARKEAERALMLEREAADARSQAKSEFIANMSHELRTPLNAILGFSEIMTTQMFGPLGSDRYLQYARDIHVSGRHLLDVVNDVLDLSKIEANQFEVTDEPIQLARMAQEVGRLIETRAAEGGIRLRFDFPVDLPQLRADARLLRQVLLNLLSNAVKFTLPGGEVVVLGHVDPADGLVLAVRDTGIGMHPEDIPRALQPFGQVRDDAAPNVEGTGLGLPLAKTIAEAHGGSLSIESEYGVGTTVMVRFPAARVVRG